jgi:hypothetical protein
MSLCLPYDGGEPLRGAADGAASWSPILVAGERSRAEDEYGGNWVWQSNRGGDGHFD